MNRDDLSVRIQEMRELMFRGRRSGINSGTALILWGIIAIAVMEVSPRIIKGSIVEKHGGAALMALGVFYLVIFGAGIFMDWVLTKKKLEELGEVLDYTNRQIGKMWAFIPLFGGYLTVVLALYEAYSFIYSMWMILVGAGMYFTGVFSKRIYEIFGIILMVAGIVASIIPEGDGFLISKVIAEVVLGGGLLFIGFYVKKRYGW